ncbi:MAG TPA: tetratricopeptide repeat protein [Vicinamibacterales bacterium]|nr:tetratricopeptide repeat protein [Vicinamibacterales bacterium]
MTTGGTSTGAHDADDGMSGRLDSWKDVAAYLKRDVSTVQRWEHREGLPIHRHLHDKLGSIYAYRHELDAWRRGRAPRAPERHAEEAPASSVANPWSAAEGGTPIGRGGLTSEMSAAVHTPAAIEVPAPARPPPSVDALVDVRRWRLAMMMTIACLVGVAVAGVMFSARGGVPVASPPRITSLVVLPLANLSGDSSQDYLAAGLTEELITRLARLQSLRVVSRTTAMSFQGRQVSVPEVARVLDVDAVLEGSVRREAGRVRISVQLIHAPTDTHVWARDFERDAGSVLALQADVARAVADEIRVQITSEERARLAFVPAVDSAAHDEYLLGRHLLWKFVGEDRTRAIAHFNRAIELAPDYAPAYSGLAHAWWMQGVLGPLSMREVALPAREAAQKALALDPHLAEALAAKAYVQGVFDWEWAGAEATIRQALMADRDSLETRYVYALLLMAMGRLEESVEQIEEAARLDPLSAQVQSTFGRILYRARRYDEALQRLDRAIELEPRNDLTHARRGDVYLEMGRHDEALAAFDRARALAGAPFAYRSRVARSYARMGREREARELPDLTPDVYVALGDREQAFARLFKAVERHDDWPIFILRDPAYDSLHADPRWGELLRRMNLPVD